MREDPMGISEIEEGSAVGIGELTAVRADLQETVFVDFKGPRIRVTPHRSGYATQATICRVCGGGFHGPLTGHRRREPDLPGRAPIPKCWTGNRFLVWT